MKFFLLLGLAICCHAKSFSQQSKQVLLYGRLSEMNMVDSTESPLLDIPIEIWSDDELLATIYSQDKGRYKFCLPFFHHYKVKYGGKDYITKIVEVDASDFALESRHRGYALDIDVLLFQRDKVSGIEFLDKEPIARAFFNKEEETVVWDAPLTESINERIAANLRVVR